MTERDLTTLPLMVRRAIETLRRGELPSERQQDALERHVFGMAPKARKRSQGTPEGSREVFAAWHRHYGVHVGSKRKLSASESAALLELCRRQGAETTEQLISAFFTWRRRVPEEKRPAATPIKLVQHEAKLDEFLQQKKRTPKSDALEERRQERARTKPTPMPVAAKDLIAQLRGRGGV